MTHAGVEPDPSRVLVLSTELRESVADVSPGYAEES